MAFVFASGNLALDLVGTLNERRSTRVENLHDADDVARWLVEAGVLDEAPSVDASTLPETLRLREALFALVEQLLDAPGGPLPDAELAVVNAAAARPTPVPVLGVEGRVARSGDWRSGLAAVARDGIALTGETEGVLKWCADPACTHPFLDRSRGHRRRWCDMAGCGDRAKAAAYRRRRRSAS